ncbi:MAG: hypothetical protein ACM3SW_04120 [Actinomycetota bacterium]
MKPVDKLALQEHRIPKLKETQLTMNPLSAASNSDGETACACSAGCSCNFDVFDGPEKERHSQLMAKLDTAMGETVELSDGYSFQLNREAISLTEIAEWITYEHRCCPFFTFELELQANDGPLWLRLRGSEDVKRFLRPDAEQNTVFEPKF